MRNAISVYRDNEDLISIGAYQRGSNPQIDRAIAMQPQIEQPQSAFARYRPLERKLGGTQSTRFAKRNFNSRKGRNEIVGLIPATYGSSTPYVAI